MTTDRGWELDGIEVQEDGTITVTLKMGTKTIQFDKPEFGIGRKGTQSAALAEFVAQSWGGDVERLCRYYASISPQFTGRLPHSLLETQPTVRLAMKTLIHNPGPKKETMKKSPKFPKMAPATDSIDDLFAAAEKAEDEAIAKAITEGASFEAARDNLDHRAIRLQALANIVFRGL